MDNSATTCVCDGAIEKMTCMLKEKYGNPSSLHQKGIEAEKEMTRAREAIAKVLSVDKGEIYFTSGGTEANNLAVFGTVRARKRTGDKIVTTAVEHASVLEAVAALEKEGFEAVYLRPGRDGTITPQQLTEAIDSRTVLVSMMLANNETGALYPVEAARKAIIRNSSPALLHCDAVQAFGKIPVKPRRMGVDLLTVSAHKIHGPKGTGAIYIKHGARIAPCLFGGEQEGRIRPGTQAVPLIAGFGAAVEEIDLSCMQRIEELYRYCKEKAALLTNVVVNSQDGGLPYIFNFSVLGFRSETMLHYLAANGVFVSSGSACAKGKKSHVLTALGLDRQRSDSALRVSFSRYTTKEEIDRFFEVLQEGRKVLAKSQAVR